MNRADIVHSSGNIVQFATSVQKNKPEKEWKRVPARPNRIIAVFSKKGVFVCMNKHTQIIPKKSFFFPSL